MNSLHPTTTPQMTDAQTIESLRAYIMSGTEMTALQKIAHLSGGNPCEPLYSIHAVATAAIEKITRGQK